MDPDSPRELPYLAVYREAINERGAGFDALLYCNRDTQRRRFEALANVAPLAGRRLVDIGCGHADLLLWLDARAISCESYLGLDAMPEFVERARAALGDGEPARRAEVEVVDLVTCDFGRFVDARPTTFVFSGSLSALSPELMRARLRAAYAALSVRSGNALVFNFLSRSAAPWGADDPHLQRHAATDMLALALELTPLAVFCQHYLMGHDATISMVVP